MFGFGGRGGGVGRDGGEADEAIAAAQKGMFSNNRAIKQVAELGAGPGGREGVDHGRTVRGEGGVSKEKGGGESEHADEVYGRLSGKPLGGLRRRKHSDGLSV